MDTEYITAQEAFVGELKQIVDYGDLMEVRGQRVKELLNRTITISDPQARCLLLPHRNDNIFAKIAETVWVLAGRNDIEWLSRYLPRAYDFSDNGRTWRAGYGPRLRNWNGASKRVDQVWEVYSLMHKDRNTRRAVISIWDPSEDIIESKDIPCNNWLNFYIRQGALHVNIAQRSSDVLWGFSGINLFEWSMLQQFLASSLGVSIGKLTYFISNIHLYERHWERADKILQAYDLGYDVYTNWSVRSAKTEVDFNQFDTMLEGVLGYEKDFREGRYHFTDDTVYSDELIQCIVHMLKIYNAYKNSESLKVVADLVAMLPSEVDFKYAAIEYLSRQAGYDFVALIGERLEPIEREIVGTLYESS